MESVTFTSGRDRSITVPAPRYLKASSVAGVVVLVRGPERLVRRLESESTPAS